MDKFTSDNLILLEFLVDSVNLEYGVEQDLKCLSGVTGVSFQFLDNSPLYVYEEDFAPKKKKCTGVCGCCNSIKSGKSCLFALTTQQAEDCLNQFDVFVEVYKKMKPGMMPEKVHIGESLISIVNLFTELVNAVNNNTSGGPVAKTMKDCFKVQDTRGEMVGHISLYVRMSSFGKLIVSQFQMNFADKAKEGHYMFNYDGGDSGDDKCWLPQPKNLLPEQIPPCRPPCLPPSCAKSCPPPCPPPCPIPCIQPCPLPCSPPSCLPSPCAPSCPSLACTPPCMPFQPPPCPPSSPPPCPPPCPPPTCCDACYQRALQPCSCMSLPCQPPCSPPCPPPCTPPCQLPCYPPCDPCMPAVSSPCICKEPGDCMPKFGDPPPDVYIPPPCCQPLPCPCAPLPKYCTCPSCCPAVPPPCNADGEYQEIDAHMGGNSLLIRIHNDNAEYEAYGDAYTAPPPSCCYPSACPPPSHACCPCSGCYQSHPACCQPCSPCCEPHTISTPCPDIKNPFNLNLSGGTCNPNNAICVTPPNKLGSPEGSKFEPISNEKEVYILRINKRREKHNKKNNIELELMTPKVPVCRPKKKTGTTASQCEEEVEVKIK